MEITSGGTPGPRLADEWASRDNNVYGALPGAPPVEQLAQAFVAAGWRARKSSWSDFEVGREWVRIELQQRSPDDVIFNGVIDPARVDELAAAFSQLGLRYSIELWDEDQTEIIRELESGQFS
jgi:hypothetical protein